MLFRSNPWTAREVPQGIFLAQLTLILTSNRTSTSSYLLFKPCATKESRDFPGSPGVETPPFQSWGWKVRSLVGELRSRMPQGTGKKKKTIKLKITK